MASHDGQSPPDYLPKRLAERVAKASEDILLSDAMSPPTFDPKGAFDKVTKASEEIFLADAMAGLKIPLEPSALAAVEAATSAGLRDPFGDGDQSPVVNVKGDVTDAACEPLRTAWSSSMDVQQAVLHSLDAPLHTAAYTGDHVRLAALIEAAAARGGERAVFEAIEKRVSLLRLNAVGYAVLGARLIPQVGPMNAFPEQWRKCVDLLISVGANVNARDIAGYSVLSIAGGFMTTEHTLALIPVLADAGADPNARTRFGEVIITFAIIGGDTRAVKALLAVGADLDAAENTGLTARKMVRNRPAMRKAIEEAARSLALADTECSSCSKKGALNRCPICRGARYCDKACQRAHWKQGHKKACTQLWEDASVIVDIDFRTMLATELAPGMPIPVFQSVLTGKEGTKMRPKVSDAEGGGKMFVVKVQTPYCTSMSDDFSARERLDPDVVGALKVTRENGAFCLVAREGPGAGCHALLTKLTAPEPGELVSGKRYYPARWQPPKKQGMPPTVLRICYAKALPPPKNAW